MPVGTSDILHTAKTVGFLHWGLNPRVAGGRRFVVVLDDDLRFGLCQYSPRLGQRFQELAQGFTHGTTHGVKNKLGKLCRRFVRDDHRQIGKRVICVLLNGVSTDPGDQIPKQQRVRHRDQRQCLDPCGCGRLSLWTTRLPVIHRVFRDTSNQDGSHA